MTGNPYNWQSHTPRVQVPRTDVDLVVETLLNNGSAVAMGGRGMGKSVFMGQVKERLESEERTRVVLVEAPPPALTVDACLGYLAELLGETDSFYSSRSLFDRYFAKVEERQRLILLFDEFDRYAEKGEPSAQPPGRGFFNDLEASRRSLPQLSILTVGSIGIFVFRDVLGSSYLSRALHLRLRPFERSEAVLLTVPFDERGTPLSEDVFDTLMLASGGIPALLTYGLQELWKVEPEAVPRDVTAIYKRFETLYGDYLRDLLSALTNPHFSDAPARLRRYIREHAGRIRRKDLEEALGRPSGVLRLNVIDALHFLESAGLVRIESESYYANPLTLRPIASLLNLQLP